MKLYTWLISFCAGVGGFLFGYEIGIINQVFSMDDFNLTFGLGYRDSSGSIDSTDQSDDIKGWITFTFLIGCALGAAIVSVPLDYIGRKRTIQASAALFSVGVAFQTAANHIGWFYAGRVIGGIGIGQLSATVPLYIAETSPLEIRGRLTAIYQLMITIGIFIASCVNSLILSFMSGNATQWRLAIGLQFIPCFFLIASVFLLPFSPRWLMTRGRKEEAWGVIAKLREGSKEDPAIQQEYDQLREAVDEEQRIGNATWAEMFQDGIRNRVAKAMTLQFFQQWTGINIILYFGTTLFEKMGFSGADSSVSFVIANSFINMVATLPGMWLIERAGRRVLLIWGGFGMAFAHFMVCMFVGLADNVADEIAWGAMIFIFMFIIAFAATWGPVVWVYQSEIFSARTSSKGTSLGTVSNWVWNAVISKIVPIILDKIDFYTYLIFGGWGIAMALYTILWIPETKGKNADDMDELFGYKSRKSGNTNDNNNNKMYDKATPSDASVFNKTTSSDHLL